MPPDDILKTIIAEGADQGPEGMFAIASTIVNRAKRRKQTLAQVVNAPKQFTGRWRTDLDSFVESQGPEIMQQAQQALERAQTSPLPGIDHYITTELFQRQPPSWATKMGGRKTIGGHIFFDSTKGPGEARMPVDRMEERLRRVYRLTAAAGFDPLTTKDIEAILARETVPSVLPGVRPTPVDEREREQQAITATHRMLGPKAGMGGGAATALQGVV